MLCTNSFPPKTGVNVYVQFKAKTSDILASHKLEKKGTFFGLSGKAGLKKPLTLNP